MNQEIKHLTTDIDNFSNFVDGIRSSVDILIPLQDYSLEELFSKWKRVLLSVENVWKMIE